MRGEIELRFLRLLALLALLFGGPFSCLANENESVREIEVFRSGKGGYHTYRIPSVVVTRNGTLLAFCEGRKGSRSDTGNIDVLQRRSTDGGLHWSEPTVLWDDGDNTCGNPCAVVDHTTGTVWMLLTWNAGDVPEREIQTGFGPASRRVFVCSSTDDGLNWSEPVEITSAAKDIAWSWYATGPGAGIQIERGEFAGRLVIPCDHKEPQTDGTRLFSHVILSDDQGRTWRLGGRTPRDQVNECEVVELSDGRLMLNMRNYDRKMHARQFCVSEDGGQSWLDQKHAPDLVEPICQASIRRLRWPAEGKAGVILFSNPASSERRERLTIRASLDDARSWPYARVLYEGGSAYSCLCGLKDGSVGCLYEKDNYTSVVFAKFALDWVISED